MDMDENTALHIWLHGNLLVTLNGCSTLALLSQEVLGSAANHVASLRQITLSKNVLFALTGGLGKRWKRG